MEASWERPGAAAASREAAAGALLLGRFRREVGYFYFRDGLGLGEDALDRLLARNGPVLSQTRATLEAKGDALRAALNLTGGDLARIVSAQPTLLGHGAAPMAAKIEWLASATGCSAADLCAVGWHVCTGAADIRASVNHDAAGCDLASRVGEDTNTMRKVFICFSTNRAEMRPPAARA